ncbi:uncharacterized protein LOC115983174 [Quercus lobata]|uniref:uncharacterized protein LOC115983174 n=1 Tax=Quercus lobata TaxID=97700 RepID=UPI001248B5D0|nr:uncharacterized protein LOC115983174 [Quercus lobata]XP_030961671.1 uncharacterized protein LOC115983174 [Quercus lobata]XP_030961672.1 uncharacterized protein LOC115983174 [Quercus lobata]XP_030961673.1 uncharacterized protein LOC115983174 [Quercus lobata]XP_030961674.1 uncharacterized protein LOC115983174 [Quercus lobata]
MKKQGDGTSKGIGSSNPSTKRKQQEKTDRPQKKSKTTLETVMGLKAETKKTVTPIGIGRGKGLMKGPNTIPEKPPVLLREDSKYALEKLASIISIDDYEDLSNHAIEAMGETGLFCITQEMLMMKGLMGRCLSHETTLERVRAKATSTEDELNGLKAWRTGMQKKLACSEQGRAKLEKQVEILRKVLEDKEREIAETKNQLYQVKEEAVCEYRDSDALLLELGESFTEGFDDALR